MATFRLNAFLARSGASSRRKADELIAARRVTVNGKVTTDFSTRIDPAKDTVQLDGKQILLPTTGVLLLYKPRGVITTLSDPEGRPTVAEYIPAECRGYVPVGRLDGDVSGLVVMTNDGELAERLMHPRYEVERTYEVKTTGNIHPDSVRDVKTGVTLDDGPVSGTLAIVERTAQHTIAHLTLHEGRNHLVKRLMEHLGHPVVRLKRLRHGPFELGDMKLGEVREVPEADYRSIRAALLTS